ncbi:MAG: signal peptide peptidase SppA [Phycisphaerae bacterium]|nr:signal peptide peptidase SppA [Phycisphaerae bacterium]NUQ46038.1 signal peptide peptidase SppA [Phycisphaerae bacterium]
MIPRLSRYAIVGCVVLGFAANSLAGEKIVHVRLRGPMPEAPPPMELSLAFGGEQPLSMFELLKRLNKLRKDDEVQGVLVELDEAMLGMAQIQELRGQFEKLRAADKDVWVFSEFMTPGHYLLASSASKVVMIPTGELLLLGLYGEGLYFKNLLDKIKVEADIIHCGDYKSAGEPLYRTGPSKESQEQTERLLTSIYGQMCKQIAESRKLSSDEVSSLFDKGWFSAEEAKRARLVDDLMYREDLNKALKKRYGSDFELVRDYGKEKGPKIDFNNPFGVFSFFGEMMKGTKDKSTRPSIAVIYVDSMIVSGKSEQGLMGNSSGSATIRRAIEKAAEDSSVKAVVLRVDSPGGSAIASDVICEAIKRCKREKPVIVSMGDVAASGGYYVSCLGDTIFAQPGTITGSIGVVGGKLVTKGMWDWLGVTSHEFKRGARADIMNTNRKFNEDERQVIEGMMVRVYDVFKERVVAGRGQKLKGEIEGLAGGRVYSGEDALANGLVDRLGGLADAVQFAADQADVTRYELRVIPEPKNLFDMIIKELMGEKDDDDVSTRLGDRWLASPPLREMLPLIARSDPVKAEEIRRFLIQLDLLATENVMVVETCVPRMK